MARQNDDGESDQALRQELIDARNDLRRQLDVLGAGPALGRDQTPDFDELKASLTEELQQVETELAKYAGEPAAGQDGDPDPVASDPEPETATDLAPDQPTPIEFHTDAPDGPPENGQFWVFAGMGIVGLLALSLLLRIFSMLWAHLMGHPAG